MSSPSSGALGPRPPIPSGVRAGSGVLVFGLLLDLNEHSFAAASSGGFSSGQHTAHLVVLVGMVLILGAIVRDGLGGHGRPRPEGRPRDAVR